MSDYNVRMKACIKTISALGWCLEDDKTSHFLKPVYSSSVQWSQKTKCIQFWCCDYLIKFFKRFWGFASLFRKTDCQLHHYIAFRIYSLIHNNIFLQCFIIYGAVLTGGPYWVYDTSVLRYNQIRSMNPKPLRLCHETKGHIALCSNEVRKQNTYGNKKSLWLAETQCAIYFTMCSVHDEVYSTVNII